MTYSMLARASCRNDGSSLLAIPLGTLFGGESPGRAQKTMMLGVPRQMLDALPGNCIVHLSLRCALQSRL